MDQNQNNQTQELDSFVEAFTAGLEPEVTDQPPATPTDTSSDDQGSKDDVVKTEGTPETNDETKTQQDSSSKDSDPKTEEEKKTDVEEVFTKSDKAFAELRIANKAQGDLLLRMTRLAKIDAKNPAQAIEMLSKHLDEIESRNGNLTYSEVEKIRQQDKDQAESKAQLNRQAHAGFEELKKLHNLSDADMLSFANELKAKSINPFETPIDIVSMYRGMHYEQFIAEAKEAGRQEELARRAKAQTQASTPVTRQGGNDTGESIKSTESLRAFLESK